MPNLTEQLIALCQRQELIVKEMIAQNQQKAVTDKTAANDVVTLIDTQVEANLSRELADLVPDAGFWGEESGKQADREQMWVVDPVDGTTNLFHGYNHSSISIALVIKGRPQLGVVHNIFTGETFYADRERGAFLLRDGHAEPLRVSSETDLKTSLVSFGLPYDKSKVGTILQAADKVLTEAQDLRRSGSAALDIAYVAAGRTEAHFELDLRPWDLMAACLILEIAGGEILGFDGAPVRDWLADDKLDVVCSNGVIGNKIVGLIA